MKSYVWLCSLQLISLTIFGQSHGDSLRHALTDARIREDRKNIQNFSSQIAWTYFSAGQYDSALKFYHECLHAVQLTPNRPLDAYVMNCLGVIYNAKGKFDSSAVYYRSALKEYELLDDKTNALNVEANLAMTYKDLDLYEESLASALHVISSLEVTDQSILKGSCYNTIGSVYTRTKSYDKALEYYRLALRNRKLNQLSPDVARILNNLGELFIVTKQYDSAAANLQQSAKIKEELQDVKGFARTINNIGKVSMLTESFKESENQLNEALRIQETLDDPVGMIEVLNNLGELSLLLHQLKRSETMLEQAEVLIKRTGASEHLRQNLELRIWLDRERRDYASGMLHLEQLSSIRDKLLNEEKNRSIQAMQVRYETKQKEQQIAILEQKEQVSRAEIRSNQILIATLILGLILVATVGVLTYTNFRNARTARQQIELLLADTRHRIKNNLQTLASIFNLQAKYFTDNNLILEAKSSESRVHAMSLLHQKFYSVSEGHSIDLPKYVSDLVNQLIDIYGFRSRNLSCVINVDDIQLDINKALPLSLIIQELVSNTFKYAFENETNPELRVEVHAQPNDELQTTISDNGPGFDTVKSQSSQGLNLVDAFVAQLDGNLQVKTEKGSTFIISFPLNPVWKRHAS